VGRVFPRDLYILWSSQRNKVPSILGTQIGRSGASIDERSGSKYSEKEFGG